ncbi:MAG: AAA family ATPase [Asgard group archaeon]|nr:AAA family ATPase [Asgard group archaeon]
MPLNHWLLKELLLKVHREKKKKGKLIHLYGKAGSGKTTIALSICNRACLKGHKTIYIDTEGKVTGTILKRLIKKKDFKLINSHLRLYQPQTFQEQHELLQKFDYYLSKTVMPLIIIDTITNLYRQGKFFQNIKKTDYKKLAYQVALLHKITEEQNTTVIMCNQATGSFKSEEEKKEDELLFERIQPVAKAVMNYWSDTEIMVRKLGWGKFEAQAQNELEEKVKFTIKKTGVHKLKD